MKISFDLFSLLSIAGIGASLVLGVLLLTMAKRNKRGNIFFFLFILTNCFGIFSAGFSLFSGLYRVIPHSIGLSYLFLLALAPLLYLYFSCLLNTGFRLKGSSILHALPLVVFPILQHRFYLSSANEKISFTERWLSGSLSQADRIQGYSLMIPFLIQATLYLLVILRRITIVNRAIKNQFSDADQRTIKWGFLILILSLAVLATFTVSLTLTVTGIWTARQPFRIISLLIPTYVLIFSFNALLQNDMGVSVAETPNTSPKNRKEYSPYRSGYSIQEERDLQALKTLLTIQKPYRDPELTLSHLAEQLSLSRGTLSWLINNRIGKNFYDYINNLRLDEALERLERSETVNILELAFDVGFRNKSTFYKFFKARTGSNPLQYIKSHRITESESPEENSTKDNRSSESQSLQKNRLYV